MPSELKDTSTYDILSRSISGKNHGLLTFTDYESQSTMQLLYTNKHILIHYVSEINFTESLIHCDEYKFILT